MADRTMEELLQAPTKGYGEAIVILEILAESFTTHLKNEISRFTQRYEEIFGEAWERFKEMIIACPHHGFSELTQIDTFYNGLNEQYQDSLNVAAGGNLLKIVNKQVITPATVKADEKSYVICGGAPSYYDCIDPDSNQSSVCAATGTYHQVSLPNQASNQMAPPGFASVQNNQNSLLSPRFELILSSHRALWHNNHIPIWLLASPKSHIKDKWKEVSRKENNMDSESDDDLTGEENEANINLEAGEIDRGDVGDKQKEIKDLILNENLSVCDVLETHLKENKRNVKFFCSFIKMLVPLGGKGKNYRLLYKSVPFLIYDHSPTVVTYPEGLKKRRRSFRFVNYVVDKEDFVDCVKKEWETEITGCHMYKVVQKLKRLKKPLNRLSWKNSNLSDKVTSLKNKLTEAQTKVTKDPFNNDLKIQAASLLNEYVEASNDEHDVQSLDSIEVSFDNVLSKEEAKCMIGIMTDEKINESVFDIDSNKASGPDGYTSGEINATMIALVPKIDVPNKVSKFRPIACSNVIYKSISKILTNRIKTGMQKVVNINQSAFIPGKHIQDNILIAQELLKGCQRKKGARRCALKVDIQKGFYTVS
nr:hypothetical protein [Tanacetum cinerariifolium]